MSDPLKFEKVSVEDAKKVLGDSLTFERVSVEDAKKVLEGESTHAEAPKVEEKDWRWARVFTPPVPLSEAAITWLAVLPADVRPTELPRAYPRIVNRLCDLWPHTAECDRYFDELTRDNRGKRKGFPAAVAKEIDGLKKHYAAPALESQVLWDNKIYQR